MFASYCFCYLSVLTCLAGPNHLPCPDSIGEFCGHQRIPGHRTDPRGIQPYRPFQPCQLQQTTVPHHGGMGSYRQDQWSRCEEGPCVSRLGSVHIVSLNPINDRYFTAAKPSTERHIFSVPIPTQSSEKIVEPQALTDVTKPSYYSAKFSPEAGFYVLNYLGLSTPWTKVLDSDRPGG